MTGDNDANKNGVTVSGKVEANIEVAYTNTLVVSTPTGLNNNNNTPYTLMLTLSAFAGMALVGGLLAQRRRVRCER